METSWVADVWHVAEVLRGGVNDCLAAACDGDVLDCDLRLGFPAVLAEYGERSNSR